MNIVHTVDAGFSQLRLNRPDKLNAIDDAMFAALIDAAALIREDESLSAVVLSGEGPSFCAGLDLSVHATFAAEGAAGERPYADPDDSASNGKRTPGRGQRIMSALREAHAPVIAALHGHVIGAGFQLALAADLRFVRPDARLALKEIDFGMTVDMGASQLLPRLIGPDRALDMIISGRTITGEEAVRWGLATRLCDDPQAEAEAYARQLVQRSRPAVHANKRLIRMSQTHPLGEGFREELRVMSANIGSPPQVEAAQAFLARRRQR